MNGLCDKCKQFLDNHGLRGTIPVCPENVEAYRANPYATKKPDQFVPVNGDHTIVPDPRPDWLPDDFEERLTGSNPFFPPKQQWDFPEGE